MRNTEQYGARYWGIKTDIAPDGEIYAFADVVETAPDGSLVLRRDPGTEGRTHANLIIPAGHWTAVFAASLIDGAAVAVEHWKGEVVEPEHRDAVALDITHPMH
jgi:hypothetical protein